MRQPRTRTRLPLKAIRLVASTFAMAVSAGRLMAQTTTSIITLPTFQVSENQDQRYRASNAVSGTGFNEKILDLPFSGTALTSQLISDIGAYDLADAATMVAGVRSAAHGYNFYRATLDLNQPLIPDVLPFRVEVASNNTFESQVVGADKTFVLAPS